MELEESKPRIQADSETTPLIKKGCTYERDTGTIVINIQLVAEALGLSSESEIKSLKMKRE